MDLSIIIVSYNTKDILEECLNSIRASKDVLKKEVIVVDNRSSDGSVSVVKEKFSTYQIVENSDNFGFSKANNIGARKARGEYLLILNSDTVVREDTLHKLFSLAEKNNSKICSCKLLNKDNTTQPQGGYLPQLFNIAGWMLFLDDIFLIKKLFRPYQQRNVDFFNQNQNPGWIAGTAMLVSRKLYIQMGGFDEKIFMYGEDVEFCYRINKNNLLIDYFSDPEIVHLGQGSGSNHRAIIGEYLGLKYIFSKHKSIFELIVLRLMLKVGAVLRLIVFGIIGKDDKKKKTYWKAFKLV